MRLPVPRPLAVAAALALGVAGLTIAPAASASAAGACLSANLSSVSHVSFDDVGVPGPSPGDMVTYHEELYDAAGNQVGTDDGFGILYATSTGALYEYLVANGNVNGGTIQASGSDDIAGSLQGEQQVMRATGTGGAFQGMTGTWSFILLQRVSRTLSLFTESYTLCAP